MQVACRCMDLIDTTSEVMVFSVNPQLKAFGGMSRELVQRYAIDFEPYLPVSGFLPPGESIAITVPGGPWQQVYALCVVDSGYATIEHAVVDGLTSICARLGQTHVSMGCVGCGFGSMEVPRFVQCLMRVLKAFPDIHVDLCERDLPAFILLKQCLRKSATIDQAGVMA